MNIFSRKNKNTETVVNRMWRYFERLSTDDLVKRIDSYSTALEDVQMPEFCRDRWSLALRITVSILYLRALAVAGE